MSAGRTSTFFSSSSRMSPADSSFRHHSDSTDALERTKMIAAASLRVSSMRRINESPTFSSQRSTHTGIFSLNRRVASLSTNGASLCE
jgi:hypothetical protein